MIPDDISDTEWYYFPHTDAKCWGCKLSRHQIVLVIPVLLIIDSISYLLMFRTGSKAIIPAQRVGGVLCELVATVGLGRFATAVVVGAVVVVAATVLEETLTVRVMTKIKFRS